MSNTQFYLAALLELQGQLRVGHLPGRQDLGRRGMHRQPQEVLDHRVRIGVAAERRQVRRRLAAALDGAGVEGQRAGGGLWGTINGEVVQRTRKVIRTVVVHMILGDAGSQHGRDYITINTYHLGNQATMSTVIGGSAGFISGDSIGGCASNWWPRDIIQSKKGISTRLLVEWANVQVWPGPV